MPGGIAVAKGYRFAMLAVSHSSSGGSPRPLILLDERFAVSNDLPAGVIEDWGEMIGTRHRWELEQASLFLWATAAEGDSANLRRAVLQLYYGLLLAVPFLNHGRMTLFEGSNFDGSLRVDQVLPYHRTWSVAGSPSVSLTVSRVRHAHRIALALADIDGSSAFERLDRVLRTFREGCEASTADARLHQFVRATEGFTVPWKNTDYAERMGEFCKGRAYPYLLELYNMRGSIEHLRGPYRWMPKSLTQRGRLLRLFQRAMLAELLARTWIYHFLLTPSLWSNFSTFEGATRFWKLAPRERARRVGWCVDVPGALRLFDRDKAIRAAESV